MVVSMNASPGVDVAGFSTTRSLLYAGSRRASRLFGGGGGRGGENISCALLRRGARGRDPLPVDVEADVAVVDGSELARRIEPVARVDCGDVLRHIRRQQA